jgi:DNA-binding CsgD family transcriptional regulator
MTSSERPTEQLAQTISSVLALGVRSRGLISTILRATLEAHRDYFAVWCAWEPDALDGRDQTFPRIAGHDATGRFVPYWHRGGETIQLDTMIGHDQSGEGDWYSFTRRHGQVCTIEKPFLHPFAGKLHWVTSEIAPIFEEGAFVGAAGIDWAAKPPPRADATPPVVSVLYQSATSEKLGRLTTREREVYYWVCQGKSNEEIALILGISANTVKNHLSPIFQKLGVENRYAAALASRESDWIKPPLDLRPAGRL